MNLRRPLAFTPIALTVLGLAIASAVVPPTRIWTRSADASEGLSPELVRPDVSSKNRDEKKRALRDALVSLHLDREVLEVLRRIEDHKL